MKYIDSNTDIDYNQMYICTGMDNKLTNDVKRKDIY